MHTIKAIGAIKALGSDLSSFDGGDTSTQSAFSALGVTASDGPTTSIAGVDSTAAPFGASPVASFDIAGGQAWPTSGVVGVMAVPANPTREMQISFLNGLNPDNSVITDSDLAYWTRFGARTAHKWGGNSAGTGATITYKFDTGSGLTEQEKETFRTAFAMWESVANVTFVEDATNGAVLLKRGAVGSGAFESDNTTNGSGFTLGHPTSATVSIDTNDPGFSLSGDLNKIGGYGVSTVIHEIGHLLGLGHAGYYNGSVTASTQQFSQYDERMWTVMSYIFWGKGTGGNTDVPKFKPNYPVTGTFWGYADDPVPGHPDQAYYRSSPHTLMQLDFEAIRQLYGANTSPTFAGGQVYGFNSNISGKLAKFYDFTINAKPVVMLYNYGLNNKLDASGFSTDSIINLTPGTFSSMGEDKYGFDLKNNIYIEKNTRIDTAIGGTGDDSITGNDYDNTIRGGAGNDTLVGGGGIDTADYSDKTADMNITLDMETSGNVYANNLLEDEILGFENAIGGSGNDVFSDPNATPVNNRLVGNGGNDSFYAGAGDDTMIGGAGSDLYSVDSAGDVVTETDSNRQTGGTDAVVYTGAAGTTYVLAANVENVSIGTYDDAAHVTGNELDNIINGNLGTNRLDGAAGKDTIDGGDGRDTMIGGDGNDIFYVNLFNETVTETNASKLTGGDDLVIYTGAAGTTFALGANIERLTLSPGNVASNGTGNGLANILTGNSGANRLDGGLLNDTMIGGDGSDTYYANVSNDVVTENNASKTTGGDDLVYYSGAAGTTFTLGANVERLTLAGSLAINGAGNSLANKITGNGNKNKLTGDSGNDTLVGGAGADTLAGGVGKDSLDGGSGADRFLFNTALSATTNIDVIRQFELNIDKIQLGKGVFKLGTTFDSFEFYSKAGATKAHDADDRIIYDSKTGKLYYDADGSKAGGVGSVLFATIQDKHLLTWHDFMLA